MQELLRPGMVALAKAEDFMQSTEKEVKKK